MYYKLYEAFETNNKGKCRQTAKVNVDFQIGLLSTLTRYEIGCLKCLNVVSSANMD